MNLNIFLGKDNQMWTSRTQVRNGYIYYSNKVMSVRKMTTSPNRYDCGVDNLNMLDNYFRSSRTGEVILKSADVLSYLKDKSKKYVSVNGTILSRKYLLKIAKQTDVFRIQFVVSNFVIITFEDCEAVLMQVRRIDNEKVIKLYAEDMTI